ncbi:MAG: aromatic amino acid ammonia-lyase [Pyrobaculum sp.]
MEVKIGKRLTLEDVALVAQGRATVSLHEDAYRQIERSRALYYEAVEKGLPIYGVTTGLGDLVKVKTETVGEDIIYQHSVGVGPPAPKSWVRAAILIRAHQLALGYSGVRIEVVRTLIDMLNKDVVPVVPTYGSVGASGDLAPLAHVALSIAGKGSVLINGKVVPAFEGLREAGIRPLSLDSREALALINGTAYSTAVAALAAWRMRNMLERYLQFLPWYLKVVRANGEALAPKAQVKCHEGMRKIAESLLELGKGARLNDPYSIRCVPQVLGAVVDSLKWASEILVNEINSPSDNPIFLEEGPIPTCHFHGQYVALASDVLAITIATWANLVERQIAQILRGEITGKADYLVNKPGEVGDMIYQYTAASIAARLRAYSSPYSVHNIPTSGLQEDVNSMSANAAVRLHEMLDALADLLSIQVVVTYDASDECNAFDICKKISQWLKNQAIPTERIAKAKSLWS